MSLKRKAGDIAADAAKKPKQNGSITSFFGAPKPNPANSSTNPSKPASSDPTAPATQPIKFDKEAWVAKLSDEHKDLLKLEIETLHESWLGALKDEVTSESFLNLKRFLKKEGESGAKIFPPLEDVYSWYCYHLDTFTTLANSPPGLAIHLSRPSKPSSSARTPTTT